MQTAFAAIETVQVIPGGATFDLTEGRLRVDFVTDRIARIRATRNAEWSKTPSLMRVDVRVMPPDKIKLTDQGKIIELRSSKLIVAKSTVKPSRSPISTLTENLFWLKTPLRQGPLRKWRSLNRSRDPASMKKVVTVDGEREVATKYVRTKDRDAWKAQVRFTFAADEAMVWVATKPPTSICAEKPNDCISTIYASLSRRSYPRAAMGCRLTPTQPRVSPTIPAAAMTFDVVDDIDYYFIAGPTMDGAVAGYRQLTGSAPCCPAGHSGTSNRGAIQVAGRTDRHCQRVRDRKIPIDTLVQDWNYWLPGHWGALEMDPKYYPDPSAMTKAIHEQNIHLMLSIWPNPSGNSVAGNALMQNGYTLAGSSFVDMLIRRPATCTGRLSGITSASSGSMRGGAIRPSRMGKTGAARPGRPTPTRSTSTNSQESLTHNCSTPTRWKIPKVCMRTAQNRSRQTHGEPDPLRLRGKSAFRRDPMVRRHRGEVVGSGTAGAIRTQFQCVGRSVLDMRHRRIFCEAW